ncbi:azurin [Cupriavidus consociatus]|uniref:azurin n=1 Tax=Cupriavidus consociatus TaxID=2821357 RepID=UPI001AE32DBE|nr:MULTISPECIES: azurin [unclassified Cupriavidus]MBP0623342.1 azurin [Cupriavidus sp. LEh25]MDK2660040.1 azurin [Cupriavidus sp. LEh21]
MRIANALVIVAFAALTGQAHAAECSTSISGSDQMQFDKKELVIPKGCSSYSVTLTHTGKLARNVMGHNWVLSSSADMQGIVTDGMAAGPDKDYLKPGDQRILGATKLIGGGQSDAVKLDTTRLKAGQDYSYYCTFPGHSSLMKGKLTVQ